VNRDHEIKVAHGYEFADGDLLVPALTNVVKRLSLMWSSGPH
jgi:hypothetical protein